MRRINLLDARLNNQSMDNLPLPGSEVGFLNLTYGSKELPMQLQDNQSPRRRHRKAEYENKFGGF
ncbi:hypothetical protein [Pseudomonas veronii]